MLCIGKGGKTSPTGKNYVSCLGLYSAAQQVLTLMRQVTLIGKIGPTHWLLGNTQRTKENSRRTYKKAYHAPVFPQSDL